MIEYLINAIVIISIFSAFMYVLVIRKDDVLINLFGSFLILWGIFEVIASLSAGSASNIGLFHVYNLTAFVLISTFFLCLFQKSKYWSIAIAISSVIYIISILPQIHNENNFYIKNILDFGIIILCLLSLFHLLSNTDEQKKFTNLKFFIFGLLLNFGGSFLIFLFFEALADISNESLKNIYTIRIFLNFTAQILFIIGLFLSPKNKLLEKWTKAN